MLGYSVGARPAGAGLVTRSTLRPLPSRRVTSIVRASSNLFPGGSSPFWSANPSMDSSNPGEPESRHNGLPDYSLKTGKIPDYSISSTSKGGKSSNPPSYSNAGSSGQRKKSWWKYGIPSASSFSGYLGDINRNIDSRSAVPQYGAGNGGGNGGSSGGGSGGWGGSGNGGDDDPMKGFTYAFALVVFIGGVSAYIRKGSAQSLMVSAGVTVLLLIAASLMGHPTMKIGSLMALSTCVCLAALMGLKSKKTGKLFPAGIVAAMSAAMSVGYLLTLI
jgi:uncharacterized membrane protein (UPF0136 family)